MPGRVQEMPLIDVQSIIRAWPDAINVLCGRSGGIYTVYLVRGPGDSAPNARFALEPLASAPDFRHAITLAGDACASP